MVLDERLYRKACAEAERPYLYVAQYFPDSESDICWAAWNPNLDGCLAQAETFEAVIESLYDARADMFYFLLEEGREIPAPVHGQHPKDMDLFCIADALLPDTHIRIGYAVK